MEKSITNWSLRGKVKVALEQATKAQRGNRGIPLPILNITARRGGWRTPTSDHFTAGKEAGNH